MHIAELTNQTLIAAAVAKSEGFTATHDVLLGIVKELVAEHFRNETAVASLPIDEG